MSYSDYTLKALEERFHISTVEHPDLFADAADSAPSELLRQILAEYTPLALAINTEKARSEMLIAPVLIEVRHQLHQHVSLFSGVDFTVDPAQGLNGVCDFILSRSPQQQFIRAPVVTVVEAKNENLKSGFGQCAAAMIGARLFDEREGQAVETVYGAVTTGTLWRFLRLAGQSLTLDQREYHLERVAKILGIFLQMLRA